MKKRPRKLKEDIEENNRKSAQIKNDPEEDYPLLLNKEEFQKQLTALEINRLKDLKEIKVNQTDEDRKSVNVRYGKEKIKLLKRFQEEHALLDIIQ
ncbi:hypothetical protein RclHR1_02160020 [Rhizophagus clarus]|nr:hypothetical protein RclHR1_02160020 [Rhizophagus clarus]